MGSGSHQKKNWNSFQRQRAWLLPSRMSLRGGQGSYGRTSSQDCLSQGPQLMMDSEQTSQSCTWLPRVSVTAPQRSHPAPSLGS